MWDPSPMQDGTRQGSFRCNLMNQVVKAGSVSGLTGLTSSPSTRYFTARNSSSLSRAIGQRHLVWSRLMFFIIQFRLTHSSRGKTGSYLNDHAEVKVTHDE